MFKMTSFFILLFNLALPKFTILEGFFMHKRYFTTMDHDKLIYFKMPKVLVYAERYKKMSNDAKVLYTICLDLIHLSMENHGVKGQVWKDENGYFIRLSIDKICELLNCGRDKAIKLKKELEKFGLLEQKRVGLNKSNLLYVLQLEYTENDIYKINENRNKMMDEEKPDKKKSKKGLSKSIVSTEVEKTDFKNSEKSTSRSRESRPHEVEISDSTNTNLLKNDFREKEVNQDPYQYLTDYLYQSKLPINLKKFFADRVSVLVDKFPSFKIEKVEYVYNTYTEWIQPKCSRDNVFFLNEIEFTNMIISMYKSLSGEKTDENGRELIHDINPKPIQNMEGLILKWIERALDFKQQRNSNANVLMEHDEN